MPRRPLGQQRGPKGGDGVSCCCSCADDASHSVRAPSNCVSIFLGVRFRLPAFSVLSSMSNLHERRRLSVGRTKDKRTLSAVRAKEGRLAVDAGKLFLVAAPTFVMQ